MTRSRPTRALIVVLTAALAVGVLALPAGAAKRFRFNGEGWGHGIGLSQYGAFGLATKRGWGAARIVKHYYKGSRVVRRDPPKKRYRVGLEQHESRIRFSVPRGSVKLRLKNGTVIETVREGKSRIVEITRSRRYRIKKGNGTVVGGRLWGGSANSLSIVRVKSALIRVLTWGHTAGRGKLHLPIVGRRSAHLVAVVPAEQYLYGLGEVPSSWPMATLQAQAIAGRTYGYRIVAGGKPGCACDILGDTRDQAYIGWDKESGTGGGRWVKAVDRSRRRVAVHNGKLITTYYSSSSGGYTENIENVWTSQTPVAYLKGVCDPGDWVSANPNRTWSVSWTARGLAGALGRPNGIVRVTRVAVKSRGVSGRVVKATIRGKRSGGATASWTTDGWDLRSRLGLRETRFWVNQNRDIVGKIRKVYDRMNCRPGLAKSNQKSIKGGRWQRFQRGRMYEHRGQNKVTWLRGPILGKYLRLRAHRGFLGLPHWLRSQAGGKRAKFNGGEILFTAGPGAHEVHGKVLKRYRRLGGPSSNLKFPTTDVEILDDGRRRSRFQGGRITCRPGGGCSVHYS